MPIRVGRNNKKPVAHKSLDRVRGRAMAKIEVSGQHYVDDFNPGGWGHPHYHRLPEFGWDLAMFDTAKKYREAGYKLLGLWEPAGIYYELPDDKMGYFNYKIQEGSWNDRMRLSWRDFLAKLRGIDMEPVFYFNAQRDYDTIVEDMAWMRGALGLNIFGLDAFSWDVQQTPNIARKVIEAIRADSRTEDATLITEGQLPVSLDGADRVFFLQHLAQLELARGGPGKRASDDANLTRVLPTVDDGMVKGCVRFIDCQGSDWEDGDLEEVYSFIRAMGCQPCDWREAPLPWK
jgi:hypothetical protein